MLKHDMEVLSDWFKANKPSKSVVMYYDHSATDFDIVLDGINIPRVKTHKFLGTWIDDDLKWSTQVSHVLNKMRTNCHLLSLSKSMQLDDCLRTICFSHIYVHLRYNLGVWGSMISKSQATEIYNMQKQCVHLLSKRKAVPVDELFKTHKVIKFPFGAKIANKLIPEPLRLLMEARGGKKTHKYDTRKRICQTSKSMHLFNIIPASYVGAWLNSQNCQKT